MADITDLIKTVLRRRKIDIDNLIFRLHYKYTVLMLLFFALMVTSKQYFGEPIVCDKDRDNSAAEVINTYCWINGTFTIKMYLQAPLFGIGPSRPILSEDEVIHHKYYQWVCFVLFLQAIFFYFPAYLWKNWEGGRLKMVINNLGKPVISSDWNQATKDQLVRYFLTNSEAHNMYLVRYIGCEVVNFINLLAQIIFMDLFLSGGFFNFGVAAAAFSLSADNNCVNPMSYVFPKQGKCTYRNYGPSGSLQYKDALCVLPLNIINEKIYIIIWFWFYILLILTVLTLLCQGIYLSSTTLRAYILKSLVKHLPTNFAYSIVDNLSIGDWYFLRQLGKNINDQIFSELIHELSVRIATKKQAPQTYGFRV